jgi:hypothetical protein
MSLSFPNSWLTRIAAVVALALLPAVLLAAPRNSASDSNNLPGETVDMFVAIQQGQIDVRLIPKDSTQSRVFITNKTDQPLNVKLPDAFAGVPVLAQNAGGVGAGAGRAASNPSNNQSQSVGGGMGGGGGGMGGMGGGGGGGGGMFNVAPEKVGQLRVNTVCLNHGQPEPRAAIPYEIRPLDSVSDKPEVREICRLLSAGQVSQRVAQAAAWHFANGMTWEQIAAEHYRYAGGGGAPYFAPQEIYAAMRLASLATTLAQQHQKSVPTATSTSSTGSLNSPATRN